MKYKDKVQQELEQMIVVGIIVLIEESKWISPMVV